MKLKGIKRKTRGPFQDFPRKWQRTNIFTEIPWEEGEIGDIRELPQKRDIKKVRD